MNIILQQCGEMTQETFLLKARDEVEELTGIDINIEGCKINDLW